MKNGVLLNQITIGAAACRPRHLLQGNSDTQLLSDLLNLMLRRRILSNAFETFHVFLKKTNDFSFLTIFLRQNFF